MPTSQTVVKPILSRDEQSVEIWEVAAERLRNHSSRVAVLGLGYAGLPMAIEFARAGFVVKGLDVDRARVDAVNNGRSPVTDVSDADVRSFLNEGQLGASTDFSLLHGADCALIAVPTPLGPGHQPDLRFVESAAQMIGERLHPGMLVVLQSTCAPGTTRKVLVPILEHESGLEAGIDFFVAFAPERIDPGNDRFNVRNTPKLVGGLTKDCSELAALLYRPFIDEVLVLSSPEIAELSKLFENTFRFINISFVNEMAMLCDRMGVSIWEVVQAAATKPFAFMPHHPGPGVGGHCIPVVPFYLEAAAREYGLPAGLIEAAGRVNEEMPRFVVDKLDRLLEERGGRLCGARVLLLGVAYKSNINDVRESPSLSILQLLAERGAEVVYHDPYVPRLVVDGKTHFSIASEALARAHFDCAVLLTAHSCVDHEQIARQVRLVLDTRHHLGAINGTTVIYL